MADRQGASVGNVPVAFVRLLTVGGRVGFGQIAAAFKGEIDAGRSTDAEFAGPLDERLWSDDAGGMEEVDIARAAERVAEVDRAMTDAVLGKNQAAEPIGLVEISATLEAQRRDRSAGFRAERRRRGP